MSKRSWTSTKGGDDGQSSCTSPPGGDPPGGVPGAHGDHRLAKDIGVPPSRINEIVHGNRAVSADTALRLARYFGTSERFWLNLQAQYDLDVEYDRIGERIEKEIRPLAV